MSTAQILAELPALPPDELETVWQTAGQLLEGRASSASPVGSTAPGAAAQAGELRPVTEDAARRVAAVLRLQASMKMRGVDFEEWKRTVREGRR